MGGIRKTLIVVMTCVPIGFLSSSAHGQVPLTPVPRYLSEAERDVLTRQREALLKERTDLNARMETHNAKRVAKGSSEEEDLHRDAAQLREEMLQHVAASNQFNARVTTAEGAFRTAPEYARAWEKFQKDFEDGLNKTDGKGRYIGGNRDYPLDAPFINDQTGRSAYNYMKVIDQFEVDSSSRYEPAFAYDETGKVKRDEKTGEPVLGDTYCNVFARDVAWAMHVELPAEMNTTEMIQWLQKPGKSKGWRLAAAGSDQAQAKANEGRMTIAIVAGHIAVIRPGSLAAKQEPKDRRRGPAIAQAGKKVLEASHLSKGFKEEQMKTIQYWYHD